MSDELRSPVELLEELRQMGEVVAKLAENEELFKRAFEFYRQGDARGFQTTLEESGLLAHCRIICRWFCIKYCMLICIKFCGPFKAQELDPEEIREFAKITGRLAQDEALLKRLVDIVRREDVKAWRDVVAELQLQRYCHRLCHWFCIVRCKRMCRLMCSPPN